MNIIIVEVHVVRMLQLISQAWNMEQARTSTATGDSACLVYGLCPELKLLPFLAFHLFQHPFFISDWLNSSSTFYPNFNVSFLLLHPAKLMFPQMLTLYDPIKVQMIIHICNLWSSWPLHLVCGKLFVDENLVNVSKMSRPQLGSYSNKLPANR